MGCCFAEIYPIPTATLPLKGREKCVGMFKLALMRLRGNDRVGECIIPATSAFYFFCNTSGFATFTGAPAAYARILPTTAA